MTPKVCCAKIIRPLTPHQTGSAISSDGSSVVIRQKDRGYVEPYTANLAREPYLMGMIKPPASQSAGCDQWICYVPYRQANCNYAGNWVPIEEWQASQKIREATTVVVNRLVTTKDRGLRKFVLHQEAVFTGSYRELKLQHPRGSDDPFADFVDGILVCGHQFFVAPHKRRLLRCEDPRPQQ